MASQATQQRCPVTGDKAAPGLNGVKAHARAPAAALASAPPAPGPSTADALRYALEWGKSPLQCMRMLHREYGDVVRLEIAGNQLHYLFHPDAIEHVIERNADNYERAPYLFETLRPFVGDGFIATERPLWAYQKYAFDGDAIESLVKAMGEESDSMLGRFARFEREHRRFDLVGEMGAVLLKSFARGILNVRLTEDEVDTIDFAARTTLKWASYRAVARVPQSWPTPSNRRLRGAIRALHHVFNRIVDDRARSVPAANGNGANGNGKGRHNQLDYLTRIVAARDPSTGEPMPAQLLRDLVAGVLGPSFVNTMLSAAWCFYRLSLHPGVRARVETELAEVLGGRTPSYDDLRLLPYTRMAVQEVLRLHPPSYAIGRKALGDDVVGGFRIPAQSLMCAPDYHVHRDPRYWQNPAGFDPERFTLENSSGRPSYAYFPFGGGSFKCIAQNMSTTELIFLVATIAQRFRVNLDGDHPVIVDERMMLLTPRDGIWVNLQRRTAM